MAQDHAVLHERTSPACPSIAHARSFCRIQQSPRRPHHTDRKLPRPHAAGIRRWHPRVIGGQEESAESLDSAPKRSDYSSDTHNTPIYKILWQYRIRVLVIPATRLNLYLIRRWSESARIVILHRHALSPLLARA